jgi:uncharacterized membrane protein
LAALRPRCTRITDEVSTAERLAAAHPSDLASVDLSSYRGLIAPWNSWEHVVERASKWAPLVARLALETSP